MSGGSLLLQVRSGEYHAPDAALDNDRRPDRRADAPLAGVSGERPGDTSKVVDPGRPARPQDHCADVVLPDKGPPAAHREVLAGPAPGGDEGERIGGLVAGQAREIGANQPPHLLGDRREQLLRRRCTRDQRRNPPQSRLDPPGRRLLLGEPGELADQDSGGRSEDRERDHRDKVGLQVNAQRSIGAREEEYSRQNAEHDLGERGPGATDDRDRDDEQQHAEQDPAQPEGYPERQRGQRYQRGADDRQNPRCHSAGPRPVGRRGPGQTPQQAHDREGNR